MHVAGVDGAKGGWLVAVGTFSGPGPLAVQLTMRADFAAVRRVVDAVSAVSVGVDMPLALPADGIREADQLARQRLGPRRSSLFPTPAAAVLDAVSHADAVERHRQVSGKGISVQAWNLMPRVREFRSAVAPQDCPRFFECHPETSFVELAGQPLSSKKTAAGVGERLRVLRPEVDRLDDVLASAPPGCAVDDVLDALAACWSARRAATEVATVLGSGADDTGYPLTITI